ncbi:hypothetical protein B296_00001393 [Ensete ventricosum]|uniref:Uncharacterized protein n=1 Tax=Ensete ventricosum TaxID=4639 RepID=A0A427AWV5_ENSVE|nr:hypothetical protein B296_00001393 [Ensete ventricosum]
MYIALAYVEKSLTCTSFCRHNQVENCHRNPSQQQITDSMNKSPSRSSRRKKAKRQWLRANQQLSEMEKENMATHNQMDQCFVAAATAVFLIYPIGQGRFPDGMPLGISGISTSCIVFLAEHNILMHLVHMLGVTGVFRKSLQAMNP